VKLELISLSIGIVGGILLLIASLLGLSGRRNWGPQWINKALLVASLCCLSWGGLAFVNLSLGSHHRMYFSIFRIRTFLGGMSAGILVALFLSGQFRAERRPSLSEGEAPEPS
jgi:hypothetical protein